MSFCTVRQSYIGSLYLVGSKNADEDSVSIAGYTLPRVPVFCELVCRLLVSGRVPENECHDEEDNDHHRDDTTCQISIHNCYILE